MRTYIVFLRRGAMVSNFPRFFRWRQGAYTSFINTPSQ